jgi:hypothetical protein
VLIAWYYAQLKPPWEPLKVLGMSRAIPWADGAERHCFSWSGAAPSMLSRPISVSWPASLTEFINSEASKNGI